MGKLDAKVAVITGGAGGIGAAVGKTFANEGAKVFLVDMDETGLKAVVDDIGADKAAYAVADVSNTESTKSYLAAAVKAFGGIDILVSNAGIEGQLAPIADCPEENFDRVLAVNVRGVFLSLKYGMPEIARRGGGSVIITSSVAGVIGAAAFTPYVTSKHAVIGMMRCAALEGAPQGIRVNTVNPGPVETRMMRSIELMGAGGSEEGAAQVKEGFMQTVPLGRYALPEEIAKLMLFLASEDSSYITGTTNLIDGGSTVD